jgi:hypothetical protein
MSNLTSFPLMNIIGLLILCCSFSLGSSRNAEQNLGYELARLYWNDNGFKCRGVSASTCCRNVEEFKDRPRDELYDDCEDEFSSRSDERECKEGIDDLIDIVEKMCERKEDSDDPVDFGYELARLYWNDNGFKCRDVSASTCCRNVEEFKDRPRDELYDDCEDEFSSRGDERECKEGIDDLIDILDSLCDRGDGFDDPDEEDAFEFGYDTFMDF